MELQKIEFHRIALVKSGIIRIICIHSMQLVIHPATVNNYIHSTRGFAGIWKIYVYNCKKKFVKVCRLHTIIGPGLDWWIGLCIHFNFYYCQLNGQKPFSCNKPLPYYIAIEDSFGIYFWILQPKFPTFNSSGFCK